MNQKIEKKEYEAPLMKVVELSSSAVLLCESGCEDTSINLFGIDSDTEESTSYFD